MCCFQQLRADDHQAVAVPGLAENIHRRAPSLSPNQLEWTNFINDYREDHEEHAGRYAYEVQRRVMLELLAAESPEIPEAFLEAVRGMDLLLRAVLVPGDFVWDTALQLSFPKEKYWYLYGTLKTTE